MLNLNKHTKKQNLNLNQQAKSRTVHMCVHIIVYSCFTQHSTEQFWLYFVLTSRQSS